MTAQELIKQCGDQAYHEALKMAVVATRLNDHKGAELFTGLALRLLQMGYHKYPERNAGVV